MPQRRTKLSCSVQPLLLPPCGQWGALAFARRHFQWHGMALALVRHWSCSLEGAAKAQIECGGQVAEKPIFHKLESSLWQRKAGNPSSCGSAEHHMLPSQWSLCSCCVAKIITLYLKEVLSPSLGLQHISQSGGKQKYWYLQISPFFYLIWAYKTPNQPILQKLELLPHHLRLS